MKRINNLPSHALLTKKSGFEQTLHLKVSEFGGIKLQYSQTLGSKIQIPQTLGGKIQILKILVVKSNQPQTLENVICNSPLLLLLLLLL